MSKYLQNLLFGNLFNKIINIKTNLKMFAVINWKIVFVSVSNIYFYVHPFHITIQPPNKLQFKYYYRLQLLHQFTMLSA